MSYPPNTKRWEKGDFVLHRADAKQAYMLMVVTGYTRSGLCKTRYVESKQGRKVWENDLKHLLDPRDFNLEYWGTVPVLVSEPKRCPVCGSKDIEANRMPQDDEFDDVASKACGFELTDENYSYLWDTHSEFLYNYALMFCEDEDCGEVVAYGERGYYNPKTNFYDGKKPSPLDYPESEASIKAVAEAERLAQEAAGQTKLFDDQDVPVV